MVKRKKKKVQKRKAKRPSRARVSLPQLSPEIYVIEKNIDGIERLLIKKDQMLPPEFSDPPTHNTCVMKFADKEEAEGFLATTFPGDFEPRAVPHTKHYVMNYGIDQESFKVLHWVQRVKSTEPKRTFKEAVRELRNYFKLRVKEAVTDISAYEKDVKNERTALQNILKHQRALSGHFEKAVAKYGA